MRLEQYLINEDVHTSFLETSACLGINPSPTFKKACEEWVEGKSSKYNPSELLELIKKEFQKPLDWNTEGVNFILGIETKEPIKTKDLSSLTDVVSLAYGMMMFVKDKVKISSPYFIHSQIKTYYAKELEVMGEIKGAKDNTADCIISSVPPSKLFSLMKETKPIGDDGFVRVGKEVYYQVSLKKSRKGAQLGKISKMMRSMGVAISGGEAAEILNDETVYEDYLNSVLIGEGLWDKITSIASSLWGKLKSALSSILSPVTNMFKGLIGDNIKKEDLEELSRAVGYNGPITESMVSDFNNNINMLNEAKDKKPKKPKKPKEPEVHRVGNEIYDENGRMFNSSGDKLLDANTQKLVEGIINNPNGALSLINKEINNMVKFSTNRPEVVVMVDMLNTITGKYENEDIPRDAFALAGNYSSVKTFGTFIMKNKDIIPSVRKLVTEMFFGGTKLPLWKVYGADKKGGKSYEYLGTIDTFQQKMEGPTTEIFGVGVHPHNSKKYYVISSTMLEGIDEKGKTFVILRTGTNSGSGFTSNFEGTGVKTIPLKKSIKTLL